MNTHPTIIRTSPKPGPFRGRCPACGKEGLTLFDMNAECANPGGMTQEAALLAAVKGEDQP